MAPTLGPTAELVLAQGLFVVVLYLACKCTTASAASPAREEGAPLGAPRRKGWSLIPGLISSAVGRASRAASRAAGAAARVATRAATSTASRLRCALLGDDGRHRKRRRRRGLRGRRWRPRRAQRLRAAPCRSRLCCRPPPPPPHAGLGLHDRRRGGARRRVLRLLRAARLRLTAGPVPSSREGRWRLSGPGHVCGGHQDSPSESARDEVLAACQCCRCRAGGRPHGHGQELGGGEDLAPRKTLHRRPLLWHVEDPGGGDAKCSARAAAAGCSGDEPCFGRPARICRQECSARAARADLWRCRGHGHASRAGSLRDRTSTFMRRWGLQLKKAEGRSTDDGPGHCHRHCAGGCGCGGCPAPGLPDTLPPRSSRAPRHRSAPIHRHCDGPHGTGHQRGRRFTLSAVLGRGGTRAESDPNRSKKGKRTFEKFGKGRKQQATPSASRSRGCDCECGR